KPAEIEKAEDDLTKIGADLDADVAADGSKTVGQLFQPQLDALKKKLDGAKIDAADKNKLSARLNALQAQLKNEKTTANGVGKVVDPDAFKDSLDALSADVDAAIKLSSGK